MTEDRPERDEQDPADDTEQPSSRPANAAARRERRTADSRPAGRSAKDAKDSTDARPAKDKDGKAAKDGDRKSARTLSGRREERTSPPARLMRFLREVLSELRKVIWPTRKELVTYTIVVLVFVSFMVALVALLDIAFAKGVLWLFG